MPGTPDTYTITVSNAGPSTVSSVTLTDAVPAALLNPVFGTPSRGQLQPGHGGLERAEPGGGAVGDHHPDGHHRPGGHRLLTNTAHVAPPAGVTDPNPGNNNASDTDTLTPQADLSVTKTDGKTSRRAGHAHHLHHHGQQRRPRAR